MNRPLLNRIPGLLWLLIPTVATAADYAGRYVGREITVTIKADGDHYGGEIHKGDRVFHLTALSAGDQLAGSFAAGQQGDHPAADRRDADAGQGD